MADITNLLNQIKVAVKGEDVRGAIHDAIEQCYTDGNWNATTGMVDLEARRAINAFYDKSHGQVNEVLLYPETENDIGTDVIYCESPFDLNQDPTQYDIIRVYYKIVATGASQIFEFSAPEFTDGNSVIEGVYFEREANPSKLIARRINIQHVDGSSDPKAFIAYNVSKWEWDGAANTAATSAPGDGTSIPTGNFPAGQIVKITGIKYMSISDAVQQYVNTDSINARLTSLENGLPTEADINEDGIVNFYNSNGISVFTLDLSDLDTGGGGGSAATYGNLVISKTSLDLDEGSSGTFTIRLDSAPSSNQPVYIAVSDSTKLSVNPTTITFTPTNYNTPQTVTVSALNDSDKTSENETISITSRKVTGKQISVAITDETVDLITNGLDLYFNFRNGSLVDSINGITATNGGVRDGDGISCADVDHKISFNYVPTTTSPTGFTIEIARSGYGNFSAGGSGYGGGYAYKQALQNSLCEGGFGVTLSSGGGSGSTAPSNLTGFTTALYDSMKDSGEHLWTTVYNTDGSAKVYIDGEVVASREAISDFLAYAISGTLRFMYPYSNIGNSYYPTNVKEIRFYKRALSESEVVQNYRATQSHQNNVTF